MDNSSSSITIAEACDILNVSEQYFLGLLGDRLLPCDFSKVEVLAYKAEIDRQRAEALDELAFEAQILGMGY
jgi:hypothetical protein